MSNCVKKSINVQLNQASKQKSNPKHNQKNYPPKKRGTTAHKSVVYFIIFLDYGIFWDDCCKHVAQIKKTQTDLFNNANTKTLAPLKTLAKLQSEIYTN